MTVQRSAAVAVLAVVAIVAVAVVASGDQGYRLRLTMRNANGLTAGADVRVGGVRAGEVSALHVVGGRVIADLDLDRDQTPVGSDASASIQALNLLGQKRVELNRGDISHPAPSGTTIPASRVTAGTDLDQVLAVLDADSRTRLGVLINEAGAAVSGRRDDIRNLLAELPASVGAATDLLRRIDLDNHTIKQLVERSDRFVAVITRKRAEVTRMVDVVGATAATVSARRRQLQATLAQAPSTLATLRVFLGDLQITAAPLRTASRDLANAAVPLSQTLAQLEPFRVAATPALDRATRVAPSLTRLADGATPVVRRAAPAAASLAAYAQDAKPLNAALMHSIDNIVAVLDNWSRAIQLRDSLGHVFRGEAIISTETLRSAIDRLLQSTAKTKTHKSATGRPSIGAPNTPPQLQAPRLPALQTPSALVPKVLDTVKRIVGGSNGPPPAGAANSDERVRSLLDYLLGK